MVVWWLIFTLALTCNATSQALSLTCNVSSQIDVVHLALKHKHYNSMVKFIKTAPDIFLQEMQSILDWKRNPNIHHFLKKRSIEILFKRKIIPSLSERDIFGNLLVGFMLNTGKKEYLFDVKLQHDFNVPCFVDASIPAGTVLLANGVPYTYQNGMAIFHAPEGGYPIAQPQISSVSE